MVLLSRVADRIYWGARYIERAEDTARVLRAFGEVFADYPRSATVRWSSLVAVAGSDVELPPTDGSDEIPVVKFLISDREHQNSVVISVERCRENLRTCREVLPRPAWAAVNDLSMYVQTHASAAAGRFQRGQFLNRVIDDSRRLDGVLTSSMSRDEAFDLWRIGRYLERTDMTTRVLGVRAATLLSLPPGAADEFAEVRWMSVLSSLSALQMYQRATKGPIDGPGVVRFLLFDYRFPRSVAGCLTELRASVLRLPRHDSVLGVIDDTDRELRSCRPAADDGAALDDAMDRLQRALLRIGDAMHDRYFMV